MTPAEVHARTNELVRLSLLREDSRADRRDMPRRKPPVVVVSPPGHVFVVPVVVEHPSRNGRRL